MAHIKLSRIKLSIFLLVANLLGLSQMSNAAEPVTEKATSYIVTYFEVYPSEIQKTKSLLKELTQSSLKEEGNLRFEIVQRIGQPDQFAILEAWQDVSTMTKHQQSANVIAMKDRLNPLLRSSYDERPHSALQVGKVKVSPNEMKNAIFAITHVDIVPTIKDQGIALVKALEFSYNPVSHAPNAVSYIAPGTLLEISGCNALEVLNSLNPSGAKLSVFSVTW